MSLQCNLLHLPANHKCSFKFAKIIVKENLLASFLRTVYSSQGVMLNKRDE